jgi:flavin reductase
MAGSAPDLSLVDDFKQAMRRLTATVAIITTSESDEMFGMVVTAVCSLGVAPPSLLISVAFTASMHDPLMRRRKFCVNLLSFDQAGLVGPFSGNIKGKERFALASWIENKHSLPQLTNAQASIFCNASQIVEYANHSLVIGTVEDVVYRKEIAPLLYENGSLARSVVL